MATFEVLIRNKRCMMPHIVMTVSGSNVDMWNTASPQPAGVASALAAAFPDLFYWQPVGNYPASVFPMGPSVDDWCRRAE